jgi:hypothetical protein
MNADSRVMLVIAIGFTSVVGVTSFMLSYAGLGAAATWGHVPSWLAWAVPVTIDGSILVYTVAALVYRARGESARVAWASLAGFASLSVLANSVHAWDAAPDVVRTTIGVVIAGLAPVAVLLTTHTLVRLVVAPPAADVATVVEPEVAPVVIAVSAELLEPAVEVEPKHVRIRTLRERGMAYSAIAKEVGVSKSTVSRVLAERSGVWAVGAPPV